MEERSSIDIPATPAPDGGPRVVAQAFGALVGFVVALIPAAWVFVSAGSFVGQLGGGSRTSFTIGTVLALAVAGAAVMIARMRRVGAGFARGMLLGAALALLVTGGSLSWLLWVCRKGW